MALDYMDLDGLQTVNDDHSYNAGDVVLQTVAKRLQQNMRASDKMVQVSG